jgi:hypothetical protein
LQSSYSMTRDTVALTLQAVKDDLLKEPREAIRALATHVWPHAGAATHWQLSLLLSLLEDCLTALVGHHIL